MAISVCTVDLLVAIPESKLKLEEATAERFECCDRQMPPTVFKGFEIITSKETIKMSQEEYLMTKKKLENIPNPPSRSEMRREMTGDELKKHRTNCGKLAWIAAATASLSVCVA